MRALAFALVALLTGATLAGCIQAAEAPAPPDYEGPQRVLFKASCDVVTPATGWSETCVALASPNPSPSKTEIDAAVDPTNPLRVVVASKDLDPEASDCVWSVAQVSEDGGRTWTTSYVGGKMSERGPAHPLFGWRCVTDPIMVFDHEGVLYYSLQAYEARPREPALPADVPLAPTGGSAILLARSLDGGHTWDKYTTMHVGDGTAAFHDYMRMAYNPATGSVYTVWNQVSVAAMVPVLVASRDGGETASPPVYLPVPEDAGGVGQSGIAADGAGTVYVMLGGFFNGGRVFLTKSVDDAQTFSPAVEVFAITPIGDTLPNTEFRTGSAVELAVDVSGGERDGWLYAAWADGRNGDADVYAAASGDGGATWTAPVRVNRDAGETDQWMPRLTVDEAGVVHVAYLTRAYDAANTLVDAEHAYSADGGQTWTTRRLTQVSFDGDLGVHQDGFPFLGDYIGIASAGGHTYVGFPHTGTGVAEIALARLDASG